MKRRMFSFQLYMVVMFIRTGAEGEKAKWRLLPSQTVLMGSMMLRGSFVEECTKEKSTVKVNGVWQLISSLKLTAMSSPGE